MLSKINAILVNHLCYRVAYYVFAKYLIKSEYMFISEREQFLLPAECIRHFL